MKNEENEAPAENAKEQMEKNEESIEELLETEGEKNEEILEEKAEKKEETKPKIEKEEIIEERFYTIPLGKAWLMPPNKRAPKAMRIIKDFVKRHMKLDVRREEEEESELKRLVVDNKVNEKIWSRGIEKPPRKIRIRAAKDKDGNVTVYLAEGD